MPRLLSLDALRGVAVILMMEQHLGVWLWQVENPLRSALAQAPGYMAINGLGGLAAPTFITLAGAGTTMLVASRPGQPVDATLLRRGLLLLGFGYLLNLLPPCRSRRYRHRCQHHLPWCRPHEHRGYKSHLGSQQRRGRPTATPR